MKRHIVHFRLDSFYVAVERLRNKQFAGKPVVVVGSAENGMVASCSAEAQQFGVHNLMSVKQAMQLCPEIVIARGDYDQYASYSRMVTQIIAGKASVVEKASIDEHYIDISEIPHYVECMRWSQDLKMRIMRETGLPLSFGLSSNKTVSKIATGEAEPCGERIVIPGQEKNFLAPLSVRKMPWVDHALIAQLRNMGITKIGTLQKIEASVIKKVLGPKGVSIWEKANGIDSSPVICCSERPFVAREHVFETGTSDILQIKRAVASLAHALALDLQLEGKLTSGITVRLRCTNNETFSRHSPIEHTNAAQAMSKKIGEVIDRIYDTSMPVSHLSITCSDLVAGSYQIDLFNDAVTDINLSAAIGQVKMRYNPGFMTTRAAG